MRRRALSLRLAGATGPLLGLLLLWGAPPGARAQGASSATLRGTVLDVSSGAVRGAEVTVRSARTTATRRAVTDERGGYVFPALTPGPYRVTVHLAGFAPWESREVWLSPGDSLQVDATLTLGGRTEDVEVVAEREMIRTDHGAQEGLITSQQIQNLSIISRGAMELLRILPGTVTPDQSSMEVVGFQSGGNDTLNQSINGARGTNFSPVIDGTKVIDIGCNCGLMVNMNPDMVDEVKIQSGNYAAEYGSSAVQITAVTKGGAASFHGSVYDYWRNWRFTANDRSNNYAGVPRPKSDYHYPGFNLSGPVLVPGTGFNRDRDTLFFFLGYEYQHQIVDQGTQLGVVPTAAQRQGDFSELFAGEGQNLGQPPVVTIPWGFPEAGQPAPGNDLSPYIDPVGRAYMDLFPMPNHSDPENRYNYAYSEPLPQNRWQLTGRLDWNVSPGTHAYVRLALERERLESPLGIWGGTSTFALPTRTISDNRSWSVALNVTSVLSPTLTNEIVVAAGQLELDNDWEDPSRVSRSALGLEGFEGVFPRETDEAPIALGTWGQGQGDLYAFGGNPIFAHNDSLTFVDNLTKVMDAHTIKLGLYVERGRKQQNFNTDLGSIGLGSTWMAGGTGNDYGDLLVGRMAQYSQGTPIPTGEFRYWTLEGFVQDSWKIRRNLTLEAGVRVTKMRNNEELTGLAMRFEPSAYDDSQGAYVDDDPERPNGILLERRGEIPKGITEGPPVKLMPRLNFAWDVKGDGDLTLRGGGGLFYNRPMGNYQYYVIGNVPNAYNATVYWYDVPGGLTISSLPEIDPWKKLGVSWFDSVEAGAPEIPTMWNWSLAAAKRIPWSQTLEVAYVGHRATHLPNQTVANYVPPGTLTGPYGNADLDNPLHRAALDSSVVAAHRIYPGYSANSWWWQYEAESTYHGLQATLSRPGRHVQYYVNYTFSKVLGTTGNDSAVTDPIDPANRSYGIVPQDRTHIFNASYNVLLPDPIAPDGHGFLRHLLNGWQVSGITSYRSGQPFRVVFGGELGSDAMGLAWWGTEAHRGGGSQGNSGAITPVFVGDPRLGNTDVGEKILDVGQIAIPPFGESGPFQSPFYFRYPSRWNFDLTVFKSFPLGSGKRIQARIGFFNLFNQATPMFERGDLDLWLQGECNARVDGVPNGAGGLAYGVCDPTQGFHFSDLTRENFGKIITKRGHRVIELAVRFDF